MNQSFMNKTVLASVISASFVHIDALAVVPDELFVTNMQFGAKTYAAGGQFNSLATVGPFDPLVDLTEYADPADAPLGEGGRFLAPGFDPATASGNIYSFDDFNGFPWQGEQKTPYLTNADSWAFIYDSASSDCIMPANVTKSTGLCSSKGSYDYDAELAAMTDDQIAVGMFFTWSDSLEIAVLEIFDCDAAGICKGQGIPMANGPFGAKRPDGLPADGSTAVFNAGLACADAFVSTNVGEPVSIDIAVDVLGNDPDTVAADPDNASHCSDPTAETSMNPEGLMITSVDGNTVEGGTAVLNGSTIDYVPASGFEGPDRFTYTATDTEGGSTVGTVVVQVGGELLGNFTMMKGDGGTYGGANDVIFEWDFATFNTDETDNDFSIIKISADTPFFGVNWFAHHIRVFDGGATGRTLSFDTSCSVAQLEAGTAVCSGGPMMELVIPAGMYGAHINFDWNGNENIDVINVWEPNAQWLDDDGVGGKNDLWQGAQGVTPHRDANWELVSRDANGDGIIGAPMIDGPFPDNYANFSWMPDRADVPPPPITTNIEEASAPTLSPNLWALLAGFMGLIGLRRITK